MGINYKYNTKTVTDFIVSLGYKVNDFVYKCIKTSIKIECNNGHHFNRTAEKLIKLKRTKCPECVRLHKRTVGLQLLVDKNCNRKGYTLINVDVPNKTVLVLCKEGHIITKSIRSILNKKHQCSVCAGIKTANRCRHSFDYVMNYIKDKGETLLSSDYKNSNTLLSVLCKSNHVYDIRFSNYTKGHRCPQCLYKHETYCRGVLERLTGYKFPKKRPEFLRIRDTRGGILELDGFNEELKLAFEYDGEQHFHSCTNWGGEERLKFQNERDLLKNKLCRENNIKLLRIPYYIKNKEFYIKKWLMDNDYKVL